MRLRLGWWAEGAKHREAMLSVIREQQAADAAAKLAVGNCWSGPKDLFQHIEFAPLLQVITEVVAEAGQPWQQPWQIDGWANVMLTGEAIARHDHLRSHHGGENAWAGVYYLAAPRRCPPLDLDTPAGGMPIVARETSIVLFPASLPHQVHAGMFDGQRISVAFNAKAAG